MSEEIEQENLEIPVEPVEIVVPDVVPELPELRYEYQPKDESGRNLGGKQVIKYKTQDELLQKLTDQNVNLVRELRSQTKKRRLGIEEKENIPEDAARFDAPLEFSPRSLTPDERVKLSRDLLDPERSEEATNTMFEAAMGAKPEVIRETLSRLSQNEMRILAKVESEAFMEANPQYFKCMENFESITGWMVRNNLAPIRQNFQLAYDTLKNLPGNIILERGDTVIPIDPIVPQVEEPVEIVPREEILTPVIPEPVPVVPVPPIKKVPTGLTRTQAGEVGPQAPKIPYTLRQINSMPADEYKRKLLHEKGFPQMVEKLESEAAANARR